MGGACFAESARGLIRESVGECHAITLHSKTKCLRRLRMNAKAILKVTLPYLLLWLAFMVLPTLLGQPEVICATPFGLILALVAGTGVVVVTGRGQLIEMISLTLAEATLAGALVGAFQGLLFAIWLPIVMALREAKGMSHQYESAEVAVLVALFIPGGIVVGGLLGAVLGALGHGLRSIGDKRRRRKPVSAKAKDKAKEGELGTGVLRRISQDFPPEDREYVSEQLKRYRRGSTEERKRIHLAILKLSAGRREAVAEYVEAALRDERDIWHWVRLASRRKRGK